MAKISRRMAIAGLAAFPGLGRGQSAPGRKVLVELFTSQGCDSCPPAEALLGRFAQFGYGLDRVIPLAFHVDYFNEPWKDVFSSPKWSGRQAAYCQALGRKELYYTPLLLADGRFDALGNTGVQVEAALKKALAEPPGASIKLAWEKLVGGRKPSSKAEGDESEASRNLRITIRGVGASPEKGEMLVGIAVSEGPLTTEVASGENKGKTLTQHHVVRSFDAQALKAGKGGSANLTVPVKLRPDWKAENCRVTVFLQAESTGRVLQAEAIACKSGA